MPNSAKVPGSGIVIRLVLPAPLLETLLIGSAWAGSAAPIKATTTASFLEVSMLQIHIGFFCD